MEHYIDGLARGSKLDALLNRNLAQQLEVAEHFSSAQHHAAERIISDRDRQAGFFADTLVQILQQGATTGEDNAAAHLRSLTVGHEVIVPVTKGKLDFGPWQRVFYGEWDGQRPKRVILKAMGD